MEKVGLLDRAIAPLRWLERARGWKRLGLFLLYVLFTSVVGVFGWRELSLWRLPNIGEPFDTAKYGTVAVADADNAMTFYREASRRLIAPGQITYPVTSPTAWDATDWSAAEPEVQRWVADNCAPFGLWLLGTECRESLLIQPKDVQISTDMSVVQSLQVYARIALLEGSRLEQEGDREGAWKIYRAVLRSSRHAGRHGGLVQRLAGEAILLKARPSIQVWMSHPKMTPTLLRRAIGDLEECEAMTSPDSEAVRAEYFAWRSVLEQPENWKKWGLEGSDDDDGIWYHQSSFVRPTERFFQYEPERSRRIARVITAGVLAQCDRPPSARPTLISGKYLIYDLDAQTPPAVASISPEELAAWAEKSLLRVTGPPVFWGIARIQAERGHFDRLRVEMAERAYEIERGKPPATFRDLLGPYLKALPEGFDPEDVISAPAEPKP